MNELAVMLEDLEVRREIEEVGYILKQIEEEMNKVFKEGYLGLERDVASLFVD